MPSFWPFQEVDPPDIPVENTTNTTTVTFQSGPAPEFFEFDPTSLIIMASLAIVFIVILLSYQFYYKPVQKRILLREKLHFNKAAIRKVCKGYDLSAYNKRAGGTLIVGMVLILGGVILGILIPNQEVGIAVILFSIFLGCLAMAIGWRELSHKEVKINAGKAWGYWWVYWPGEGWEHLTAKRLVPKERIEFDEAQHITLRDQVYATLDDEYIKNYWDKFKLTDEGKKIKRIGKKGKRIDAFKESIKEKLLERLKSMIAQRFELTEKFDLLMILKHPWNDVITDNDVKVLDVMEDVDVKIAPQFLVYAGPATKIFETVDTKGLIRKTDRTMGVMVSVFDRVDALEYIMNGHFDTLDVQDALVGQMLHSYEQECTDASEQDKRLRKIEDQALEIEKKDNEKDNKHAKDFNNLSEAANFILGDPPTKTDQGVQLLIQGFALFGIVMMILYILGIIKVA